MSERNSDEQGQPTLHAEGAILGVPVEATPEQPRFHEVIDGSQIRPNVPEIGGAEIVLQRHGKYIRNSDDPRVGSLTPEAAVDEEKRGEAFLQNVLGQLPPDQRESVDILIVASYEVPLTR